MRVVFALFAVFLGIGGAGLAPATVWAQQIQQTPQPPQTSQAQPAPQPQPVANRIAPLPLFVVDARIALPHFGSTVLTTTSLNLNLFDMPTTTIGSIMGLQVYALRRPAFAIGIGGEYIVANAKNQPVDATGADRGPAIERHFHSTSVQLSFNFGHRMGWSYITGGMGPLTYDTFTADTTPNGLHPSTINYGGGARWFSNRHVALSLDLRFYGTKPALATDTTGARARQSLMIFSAGISIKR
jgi:hypothetical protein